MSVRFDHAAFLQSRAFKTVLFSTAGIAALLFAFKAGVTVGYEKASFSYRWGENYHRNFAGPQKGFAESFAADPREFIDAHGAIGQIIAIHRDSILVRGRDGVERVVVANPQTAFADRRARIGIGDLLPNDTIVVLGEPDDEGRIAAKFVRRMPAAPLPPPVCAHCATTTGAGAAR